MGWTIRRASEEDLDAFAEIVDHYILATAIHFGDRPQTRPEWLALWQPLQNRYPWLVAGRGGTIGGIAYARP